MQRQIRAVTYTILRRAGRLSKTFLYLAKKEQGHRRACGACTPTARADMPDGMGPTKKALTLLRARAIILIISNVPHVIYKFLLIFRDFVAIDVYQIAVHFVIKV